MFKKIKDCIEILKKDTLYSNSIYLILSTAIMAFFGFFFWIINARLFTSEQVGIATTLISIASIISSLSILGFNMGLIRYLPKSENKNSKINSCFTLDITVSIMLTIIFIFGINIFSPKLSFLRSNSIYGILLILFVATTSINTLIESIFSAYRSSKYTLLKNFILSIVKIILPITLVFLGAFGIYASVGVANIVAIVFSILMLVRKFGYKYKLEVNPVIVKRIFSFSFGNYVAGFIAGLPAMILPIIITNRINPRSTAYYYMAMMIANLIFIIPQATTQSLFAEGSNSEDGLKVHISKSVRIISMILLPTVLIMVFAGKYILLFFGKDYSLEAFSLLRLLTLSSLFVAVNSVFGTILRVKGNIRGLIAASFMNALTVFILSFVFINLELLGIGLAWIIGQISSLLVYYVIIKRRKLDCSIS